jgi:hypothetical protein
MPVVKITLEPGESRRICPGDLKECIVVAAAAAPPSGQGHHTVVLDLRQDESLQHLDLDGTPALVRSVAGSEQEAAAARDTLHRLTRDPSIERARAATDAAFVSLDQVNLSLDDGIAVFIVEPDSVDLARLDEQSGALQVHLVILGQTDGQGE